MKTARKPIIVSSILLICSLCAVGCNSNKTSATEADVEQFCGSWYGEEDSEISIDITANADGGFMISITDSPSPEYILLREMEGTLEHNEIRYRDGKKYCITYDTFGENIEDEEYADGSGSLQLTGNQLTWKDKKEHYGDGITFVRN